MALRKPVGSKLNGTMSITKVMEVNNRVDMWYGNPFMGKKYAADAFFSDTDCVYRGNIYDENGRMIGDYESSDSTWIEQRFNICWK